MRKNQAKQAFRELKGKLKVLEGREELGLLGRFNESVSLVTEFLKGVRAEVLARPFEDRFEEIYFFKFEKPEYYAVKVYQVALFSLLNQCPAGPPGQVRRYYLEELEYVLRFFKQHAFYYEYYRSGFTELDEVLFLRGSVANSPLLQDVPELDAEFSTNGDYLFAKFTAYELLQEYILGQLTVLDAARLGGGIGGEVVVRAGRSKKWFEFTGELINVVELGYAIYVSRQLNGGRASLAEIFRWLEESFGIEIGIPANRLREIKRRKRLSRTHFLELMQQALIAYMDEDDAYDPEGKNGKGRPL